MMALGNSANFVSTENLKIHVSKSSCQNRSGGEVPQCKRKCLVVSSVGKGTYCGAAAIQNNEIPRDSPL